MRKSVKILRSTSICAKVLLVCFINRKYNNYRYNKEYGGKTRNENKK